MTLIRLLLCLALIAAPALRAADDWEVDTDSRVVAFGDVHGAFDDWTALLVELGVIDEAFNWTGGDTHLVSLGDLIDRGPGSRDVVELLMKLEGQAQEQGGAVHMVLGNHEVMVMKGDLRYVSSAEYAAFAGDETQAQRDAMYADFQRYFPDDEAATDRAVFDRRFPPGYIGLREAYSPSGELGQWLLQQPFVIRVNDRVYIHGGIASDASERSIEDLNSTMGGELERFLNAVEVLHAAGQMPRFVGWDQRLNFLNARASEFAEANPGVMADWFDAVRDVFASQEAFVFSEDSPNWYRGSAVCHPYAESYNTERFLKRAGARQLVVGHTPTGGDVLQRMEGLVLRLDTGMLRSHYKGKAAALVSDKTGDYVHYLGDEQRHTVLPEQRSLSQRLSRMSDAQLENFMRTAPVVAVEDIGTGVTNPKRVTQELDGVSNDAVFKYEDTQPDLQNASRYIARRHDDADRYQYDVAAYRLDRLIDLQMVPTAVLAEVDGREGALSDWAENTINERDRVEQDVFFASYCKQFEQYRLRFIFDVLTYNDDRNLTNILWDRKNFMLMFIDHSLAFGSREKRPKQYRKVPLEVSDLMRSKLESLNRQQLDEALSPFLHPRQIEAILARRDLILKEAVGTEPK